MGRMRDYYTRKDQDIDTTPTIEPEPQVGGSKFRQFVQSKHPEITTAVRTRRPTPPSGQKGFDMGWRAWLDRLLRGQYGSAALFKELAFKPAGEIHPMAALKRGFTGQEKASYREVAEKVGLPAPAWFGFAGDVLLDPTTYLSLGSTTAGKVGAKGAIRSVAPKALALKVAGRPVLKSVKAQQALSKIGQTALRTPGVGQAARLFARGTGISALDDLVKKYKAAKEYGRAGAIQEGQRVARRIAGISKKLKRNPNDVANEVVRLVEKYRTKSAINRASSNPQIAKLSNDMVKVFAKTLKAEQKAGMSVKALGAGRLEKLAKLREQLKTLVAQKKTKEIAKLRPRIDKLESEIKLLRKRLPKEITFFEKKPIQIREPGARKFRTQTAEFAREIEPAKLTGEEIAKQAPAGYRQIGGQIAAREKQLGIVGRQQKQLAKIPVKLSEKRALQAAKQLKIGGSIAKKIGRLRAERELGYFPRFAREEVIDFLQKARVGKKRVWSPKIANELERKTGDFTLDEFNKLMTKMGLPESINGKKLTSFFSPDPAYALSRRLIRSSEGISSAKFLDEVAETFGRKKPRGFTWSQSTLAAQYPKLKGVYFDNEILGEVDRVFRFYTTKNEGVRFFIHNVFDPVQNWWKAHVLAYFPAYHVRNTAGNLWNNFLGGVIDPRVYEDARRLQFYSWMKRKGLKVPKPKLLTKVDVDQALKTGEQLGVPGRGLMHAEIPRSVEIELMKGNWNILSQNFQLVKKGRAVGTAIENHARWAHYIDKLKKGWDPGEAADSVKKFLFDYGDLTDFERGFMKRVFPFYTWTRKNIPLQLEMAIKKPGKLAVVGKAREAIQAGTPPPRYEEKILPDWIKERLPVRVGQTPEGQYQYFPLEGWLPAADIMKLGRPGKAALEMMTPFLRVPAEMAMGPHGRSFYFDQPIERYTGERTPFMGKEVSAKAAYPARSIRLVSELARLFPRYPRAPESVKKILPPELSGKEKAVRALTGIKVERIKPEREKVMNQLRVNKELRDLGIQLRRVSREGRTEEAERIKALMRKVIAEKLLRPAQRR